MLKLTVNGIMIRGFPANRIFEFFLSFFFFFFFDCAFRELKDQQRNWVCVVDMEEDVCMCMLGCMCLCICMYVL